MFQQTRGTNTYEGGHLLVTFELQAIGIIQFFYIFMLIKMRISLSQEQLAVTAYFNIQPFS